MPAPVRSKNSWGSMGVGHGREKDLGGGAWLNQQMLALRIHSTPPYLFPVRAHTWETHDQAMPAESEQNPTHLYWRSDGKFSRFAA